MTVSKPTGKQGLQASSAGLLMNDAEVVPIKGYEKVYPH